MVRISMDILNKNMNLQMHISFYNYLWTTNIEGTNFSIFSE